MTTYAARPAPGPPDQPGQDPSPSSAPGPVDAIRVEIARATRLIEIAARMIGDPPTMTDAFGDRQFITAPELAQILDMDERSVRRALASGELPGIRIGSMWRIPTAKLRELTGTPTSPIVELDEDALARALATSLRGLKINVEVRIVGAAPEETR